MAARLKTLSRTAVVLVLLALVAWFARDWLTITRLSAPGPKGPSAAGPNTLRGDGSLTGLPGAATQQAASGPTSLPAAGSATEAEQALRRGLDLHAAGDLLAARLQLGSALAGGQLSPADTVQCRTHLAKIGDEVVFNKRIIDGDPDSYRYVVKSGDTLYEIVAREKLAVSPEAIQQINNIPRPSLLQPGQWIKLVRGPFDVVVTKHAFTLDLYQHGVFTRGYKVGLGQNGSTPVGKWIVKDGGRVRHAPWTPPPSASQPSRTVLWGAPDYPLGKEGLWISLTGTEPATEMLSGFGIHGTNDPESIGKQASLGCVRLADADIAELFGLLCEGKSKVEIRP